MIIYIWKNECDDKDVIIQKVLMTFTIIFLKRTRGKETTHHLIQLHSKCVISAETVILYTTYSPCNRHIQQKELYIL
jgi:hypothetical protein